MLSRTRELNMTDKKRTNNSAEKEPNEFASVQLADFEAAIEGYEKLLVLTHDNPDPDAIGSAFAVYSLLSEKYKKDVRMGHGGFIGRTENKLMILDLNIPLYSMQLIGKKTTFDGVIIMDTQPEAKYHTLPSDANVIAVFDHHPLISKQKSDYFKDVRPDVGSTSTIITHYLHEAGFNIDKKLATALFYGIKTDTLNFSRHTTRWDIEAHQILFPLVDFDTLVHIENPPLPREYFVDLQKALQNAEVFDNTVVISSMGLIFNPDMIPLVADILLKLDSAEWVIVMGYFKEELRIAVRCSASDGHAGKVIKKIVKKKGIGGGHAEMAAAQIKLKLADKEVEYEVIKQMVMEIIKSELKLQQQGLKLCREKRTLPPPGATGKFPR